MPEFKVAEEFKRWESLLNGLSEADIRQFLKSIKTFLTSTRELIQLVEDKTTAWKAQEISKEGR